MDAFEVHRQLVADDDRLAEQRIPDDIALWKLDNCEAFLGARRATQTLALNTLFGLLQYSRAHGIGGDDEDIIESTEGVLE